MADPDDVICSVCDYRVPQYVRLASGAQRSGWRMLMAHRERVHEQRASGPGRAARVDDCCPICDGKGCDYCEPHGPQRYNGNTGEPLPPQGGV